jgi:hypothetical protein
MEDDVMSFGAHSGGHTVRGKGMEEYRHEAAAAQFSHQIASRYYGFEVKGINGYVWGSSGGSMQTSVILENT